MLLAMINSYLLLRAYQFFIYGSGWEKSKLPGGGLFGSSNSRSKLLEEIFLQLLPVFRMGNLNEGLRALAEGFPK